MQTFKKSTDSRGKSLGRNCWLLVAVCSLIMARANIAIAGPFDKNGVQYAPFVEWSQTNTSFSGNPFDLGATVTFTHQASSEVISTPMFYDGSDTWKWRFSGSNTGEWNFTTSSADSDLDGLTGSVQVAPNPNPEIGGSMVGAGTKFARQVGEGELDPVALQVYMNMREPTESNPGFGKSNDGGWSPIRLVETQAARDSYIQQAQQSGMNAIFFQFNGQWYNFDSDLGRTNALGTNNPNPDLRTFQALEQMIQDAHGRGVETIIWAWGDDARSWTPSNLLGGQNGEPDTRLQNYIAARLGPVAGWSMGYGFDLGEWASEQEVSTWATNLQNQMGWQHMLWGRERSSANLDAVSNDIRPDGNPRDEFYNQALNEIQNSDQRPVIFERRFGYMRDNVWDDETMRRAMWQFSVAGGAAGWWGFRAGTNITAPGPFAEPETFRTHQTFWNNRLLLEMNPHNELTGGSLAFALAADDLSDIVVYQEDSSQIQLNLATLAAPILAIAIDTKAGYTEIPLGLLSNSDQVWTTPYESDWAIALGSIAVKLAGDFDLDSDVDGFDFLKWQRGESFTPYSAMDYADWEANFGKVARPIVAATVEIPEPSALLLGAMASLVGISFRCHS
jgi:hypothetical protein